MIDDVMLMKGDELLMTMPRTFLSVSGDCWRVVVRRKDFACEGRWRSGRRGTVWPELAHRYQNCRLNRIDRFGHPSAKNNAAKTVPTSYCSPGRKRSS
jgi:hypothetical protein